MRKLCVALCLVVLPLLAGCVVSSVNSLYPSYTAKDVRFDATLIGTWRDTEENSDLTLTFRKAEGNAYTLILKSGSEHSTWEAHLAKLDGTLFLDLYPAPPQDRLQKLDASTTNMIGLHQVLRLRREGETIHLAGIDEDWWEAQRKAGTVTLSVANPPGQPQSPAADGPDPAEVVTSSTVELQQFLISAARDPKAFVEILSATRPISAAKARALAKAKAAVPKQGGTKSSGGKKRKK